MKYIIHSKSECGFWHNKMGWVYNIKQATQFDPIRKMNRRYQFPLSKGNDAKWIVADYGE